MTFVTFLCIQTCIFLKVYCSDDWLLIVISVLNVRVPSNCPRSYHLMTDDPDGDRVICRYGTIINRECATCNQPQGFELDEVGKAYNSQHNVKGTTWIRNVYVLNVL